jgi:hypothetical protein
LIDKTCSDGVWQDTFVEEGSLARRVPTLRKTLGEKPRDQKYMVTGPGARRSFSPAALLPKPQPDKRKIRLSSRVPYALLTRGAQSRWTGWKYSRVTWFEMLRPSPAPSMTSGDVESGVNARHLHLALPFFEAGEGPAVANQIRAFHLPGPSRGAIAAFNIREVRHGFHPGDSAECATGDAEPGFYVGAAGWASLSIRERPWIP